MSEKYFLINPSVDYQSKRVANEIALNAISANANAWDAREQIAEKAMHQKSNLKWVQDKVILKVDLESKNRHSIANGLTIRRERRFNNFNFREVNPSNAFVVSAENIPEGAEVLIDYTYFHDSYKIFDIDSGSNDVAFYSVKEDGIFAWRTGKEDWKPSKNSEFGLRVYKPYEGNLIGIQPTFMKDVLFVSTGDLKGKIVRTLRGCDYQIVYANDEGKEGNLIRFKHSEDSEFTAEEVICIDDYLTELYYMGKLLVGISPNDAKTC